MTSDGRPRRHIERHFSDPVLADRDRQTGHPVPGLDGARHVVAKLFLIFAGDSLAIGRYRIPGLHARWAATQILGVHDHHRFGFARVHVHLGVRGRIALIRVEDLGDRCSFD
jgi:hypothetical protein